MPRTLILLVLIAAPVAADTGVGLTATQLDAWLKTITAKKERPTLVQAHSVAGRGVYTAISVANPDKLDWSCKHSLTTAAFNERFKKIGGDGYRLDCVCIYFTAAGPRFTDLWTKDAKVPFSSKYGLTSDEFKRHVADQAKLGFRPVCINGYVDAKAVVKFVAVFHQLPAVEWKAHQGVPEKEFAALMKGYKDKGFRPSVMSTFNDGKGVKANFVVEHVSGGWAMTHGVTAGALQKENEGHLKSGLVPGAFSGHASGKGSRYTGYWAQPGGTPVIPVVKGAVLPVSGTEVPGLAAFDKAMLAYMKERDIEAGTICVTRNGKVALSRGYGFLTKDHKRRLSSDAPLRIASLAKPITAAIVLDLAAKGKFKLDDRAFTYIGVEVGPKGDLRLKDITIQQLLDHKGGFDSEASKIGDPMMAALLVRKELKLEDAPTPQDMIRFMAGRKLDFAPGAKEAYSNFGYCVLGRVIEKATGETYAAYVRKFLAPLGVKTVTLSRSLPDDRDPAEPFYYDPLLRPNVISGTGSVPYPDGGLNLEAMDSHGGLICSAPDYAKFMQAYWLTGQPRKGGAERWLRNGTLPGTFAAAIQRADGVNIVALFNQRSGPRGKAPEDINHVLDKVADTIKEWP
jgi:N-acyl-D-amino-acid deacylase